MPVGASIGLISNAEPMEAKKTPLRKLTKHPLSSSTAIVILHLEEALRMVISPGKLDSGI